MESRIVRFLKARRASVKPWYFRIFCEFYCPVMISAIINIEAFAQERGALNTFSALIAFASLIFFICVPVLATISLY